ncbi:hypothetical protein PISMIDRAFT_9727 [Pisolithus microcarpus 441]|uniref:Uncharacterized protein n=1 Tax=Pisolithus microcarpus 441 TaxID=765257 RepID=A0A0C9ZZC3_9AGAM|nr:hypothetical protein BKA83DRAFT_9724 [Pisolithus microcarpus]KIK25122.1 hypothetical protein PISMIDRAFT_9724 [Pisolithus microcarpus 441]KIK25128.1 hypothetical protein PISMIDRAFT_9727 [Pisolithus microcarpus 441]
MLGRHYTASRCRHATFHLRNLPRLSTQSNYFPRHLPSLLTVSTSFSTSSASSPPLSSIDSRSRRLTPTPDRPQRSVSDVVLNVLGVPLTSILYRSPQ